MHHGQATERALTRLVLRNLEHGRANVLPFTRARPLRAGGATQRVAPSEPRKRRASQRPRVGCYGELAAATRAYETIGHEIIRMIVSNDTISMHHDALDATVHENSAASPVSRSVARDYTPAELRCRSFEVDARSLASRAKQSVIRDSASPHPHITGFAPDASSSRFHSSVRRVSLDRTSRDFDLAADQKEACPVCVSG